MQRSSRGKNRFKHLPFRSDVRDRESTLWKLKKEIVKRKKALKSRWGVKEGRKPQASPSLVIGAEVSIFANSS